MAPRPAPPKYALREIERRWLVQQDVAPLVRHATEVRRIEDRYIEHTHLRLRKIEEHGKAPTFKLGKKYAEGRGRHGYVVSVYLTREEYAVLLALPGRTCTKHRYQVAGGAVDVYEAPRLPFATFEREFGTVKAAEGYVPPDFTSREITDDPEYSGYMLARTGH
jgi:CYTH domain-containing protein